MTMPGRRGSLSALGTWQGTGGSSLPAHLSLNNRINNTPSEYKATIDIEFVDGFESGDGDGFGTFITTDNSGGGAGSGSDDIAGGYRYGFNGKENDNEVEGEGNQQDYGMRIYDPRIGKFLSVDPLTQDYPWSSPYAFAENDVIRSIDLDGLEKYVVTYWYNNSNEVTRTTIKAIREKATRNLVDINFRTANGNKLTTQDVYVRHLYNNGRVKDRAASKSTLNADERGLFNKAKSRSNGSFLISYDLGDQRGGANITSQDFNQNTHQYRQAQERQFNQKGSVLGAVGTTDVVAGEKNGTIHLEYTQAKELNQLVKDIKADGGYDNGTVSVSLNASNVTDEQFAAFKKGVEYVGEQFKKVLEKAGVKNVKIDTNATRDQPSAAVGLKIKINN